MPSPEHADPLASITADLLASDAARRREGVRRAERVHDEIEPTASYPLDYLAYRLRGRRAEASSDAGEAVVLPGEAARSALRGLIDAVSRTLDWAVDEDEPAQTIEELASRLNVSTKTIQRWRKAGLRWRWAVAAPEPGAAEGGASEPRRVIVLPRSAVERFRAEQGERVERAKVFTQMTDADRDAAMARATEMVEANPESSLNAIATALAAETGRAVETLRQLLERHDREHPREALFGDRTAPLTARQKRVIYRAYRMGVSVTKMAARFGKTRSTIYRAINERRLAGVMRVRLPYVTSRTFSRPDADEVLLRPEAEDEPATHPTEQPPAAAVDDLPEPVRPLYRQPMVREDHLRSLFVRYNYVKHRANAVRDRFSQTGETTRAAELDEFERLLVRAKRLQATLVKTNLPVVLSVARRHLLSEELESQARLLELLEVGNVVLIDAVDGYDASRSQSFRALLTNRLLQTFASEASLAKGRKRAIRRRTGRETLRRMVDLAGESGVHLVVEESEPRMNADKRG